MSCKGLSTVGVVTSIEKVARALPGETQSASRANTVKAKVQEGPSLAAPALTAAGVACSEGTIPLSAVTNLNASFGLSTNTLYSGTYVTSVTTSTTGTTGTIPVVTIVYKAIGSTITAGDTVVYTGTCGAGGLTWGVSGTGTFAGTGIKYLPKT